MEAFDMDWQPNHQTLIPLRPWDPSKLLMSVRIIPDLPCHICLNQLKSHQQNSKKSQVLLLWIQLQLDQEHSRTIISSLFRNYSTFCCHKTQYFTGRVWKSGSPNSIQLQWSFSWGSTCSTPIFGQSGCGWIMNYRHSLSFEQCYHTAIHLQMIHLEFPVIPVTNSNHQKYHDIR